MEEAATFLRFIASLFSLIFQQRKNRVLDVLYLYNEKMKFVENRWQKLLFYYY